MKKRGEKTSFITLDKTGDLVISKKGLSEIVSTLIIILLTLVAIGIIWVVINSLIRTGTQQIGSNQYNADLQITKVRVASDNITVTVYVKNAGQGNFTGIDFVFSNGTTTETIIQNTTLVPLQEKSFSFVLSKIKLNTLQSVSVAPVSTSGVSQSVGSPTSTFDVSKIVSGVGAPLITNFEKLGFGGTGKVEYAISNSNLPTYPQFIDAIVNPLDVQVGQNQTFTATVYSPYNVTNVSSFTQLDTSNLTLNFIKISDDNIGTSIWSANWTVYDTHTTTYKTTINATDFIGRQSSISLNWADPATDCNTLIFPSDQGNPKTISASCTIFPNEVTGVMGGKVTIGAGYTVTINSGGIFVTQGFTLGSGAHLALTPNAGASIRTNGGSGSYLYYFDADGDRYAPNSSMIFSTSPSLSGYVLANNTINVTDCYDNNPNVYPGSFYWGTAPRGNTTVSGAVINDTSSNGTSWDFNCDGIKTLEWTANFTQSNCDASCATITIGRAGWYPSGVPNCGGTANWGNSTTFLDTGGCSNSYPGCHVPPMIESRTQGCQ